jgi:hypothetical protein
MKITTGIAWTSLFCSFDIKLSTIFRAVFMKITQYRKIPVLYQPRYWIFNTELETLVQLTVFVNSGL